MLETTNQLSLVVIGKVNAGKSSLINALLRRPVAKVHPRAGETRDVRSYRYNDWFRLVDTPGLEDVEQDVVDKTRAAIRSASVILFLVNCGEGATRANRAEISQIRASGVPWRVLLSRCDLISDPVTREDFAKSTATQLGVRREDCLLVSTMTSPGVEAVSRWILELEIDDQLWARILKSPLSHYREQLRDEVNQIIWERSIAAAAIAAIPVPIVDIAPITAVQIEMAYRLSLVYGETLEMERLKEMVAALMASIAVRKVFRQIVKLIPVVGWVLSASIAFAGTMGLGKALTAYYERGMNWDEGTREELGELAVREAKSARKRFNSDRELQKTVRNRGRKKNE